MFVEKHIASIDESHTCRHYSFIGIRYVAPTIINTFLESYDFAGKKIVLFATSGGSGFGNTVSELKPSALNAVIVEGKVFGRTTKQEIAEWLKSIS